MDTSSTLKSILKYSWLIVLFGVVTGGLAYVVSNTLPKEYESESRVLVGSLTEPDLQRILGYKELAQVYASLATSPVVLEGVSATIDSELPLDELAEQVTSLALVDQAIIRIVGTAATAEQAAALANAVADQIVELARPAPLGPSLARVIEPAVVPDAPSSPTVIFNAAVAALLGMAIGTFVALLIAARFDARAKQPARPPQEGQMGYPSGPYSR